MIGLVVEFIVAIDEARVRFADHAFFFSLHPALQPRCLESLDALSLRGSTISTEPFNKPTTMATT